MKAYTDIDQSKKLAEILPPETADMRYSPLRRTHPWVLENDLFEKDAILCWSLAALLNVLPDYTLQTNSDGTVFLVCDSKKPMISDAYNNPVDACVDMIEKLHELNLL